jgi:hypothetical protein
VICFKNFGAIIETLLENLQDSEQARCWNIVIPPAFAAARFATDLCMALRTAMRNGMVACISADGLATPLDLIRQVQRQWLPDLEMTVSPESDPQILITDLLNRAGGHREKILVITEFHKMLGKLDERILVAMRDAEQAGRMRTVAISIYPYKWIKTRWKKEGYLLHVSNYGDSHAEVTADVPSHEDVCEALKHRNVTHDLVEMAYEWTGGYPDAMEAVISKWETEKRPDLTPSAVAVMKSEAERVLDRLARQLDAEGEDRFRALISRLHQRTDEREPFIIIKQVHPWARILLDEEGLRADCLGEVVVKMEVDQAFSSGQLVARLEHLEAVARSYYKQGQYDLASDVVMKAWGPRCPPQLRLLTQHASIMLALRGGATESRPDVDCDWRGVIRNVEAAVETLPQAVSDGPLKKILTARYEDLQAFANSVCQGLQGGECRVVDALAGLRAGRRIDAKTVFTLLVLHAESGRRIRGNSAACKFVLEMPEQLVRIWAFWKLEINYYRAPIADEEVISYAKGKWPEDVLKVGFSAEGEPFRGAAVFARYLFVVQELGRMVGAAPWADGEAFERDLAVMRQRNDPAHAVSLMNAAMRKKMFAFIDRWIEKIEVECDQVCISRRQALEQFEPLPLP